MRTHILLLEQVLILNMVLEFTKKTKQDRISAPAWKNKEWMVGLDIHKQQIALKEKL